MLAGFSIEAVVSKLEAGDVPVELAHAPVAACLMNNANGNAMLGDDGVTSCWLT